MVMDTHQWQSVEAEAAVAFNIAGQTAVRARDPMRGSWITVAEGFVANVSARRLELEDDVTLTYALPGGIDLSPLVGSHVRIMLREDGSGAGRRAQTLTISGSDGRACLVARFGPGAGQVHTVGKLRLRAALSQRPGGPMVFGTDKLQYVLQVGEMLWLNDGQRDFVMRFVARTACDCAAYVVAERRLWQLGAEA
jgi:hypothetical protein